MHLSWMLPVLHSRLLIVTQLEAGLTKKAEKLKAGLGKASSFELSGEACNTYKSENKKYKELTWRVVGERYNTTKIDFVLHKSEKENCYAQNNMVLEHMNIYRIEVRLNGYKYLRGDFKWDFSDANEDYSNAYQQFLQIGYKHKNAYVVSD